MIAERRDLTRPGEKDDFIDILRKQEEELRAKYDKQLHERGRPDQKKGQPDAGR